MNKSIEENSSSARPENILSERDSMLWTSLFFIEAVLVLFSNCLSLFIFLKKRFLVKKSTYLIICLTMADLLVGISVFMTGFSVYKEQDERFESIGTIFFDIKTSLTTGAVMLSLLLLALIAMERFYAVVFPLRHRISKTSHYYIGIASCWIVATVLSLCITFFSHKRTIFANIALAIGLLMLVIIFTSYFTIWVKIKCYRQPAESKRSEQEHRNLAKTLFIITVLSLMIYVPKLIVSFIQMYCNTCNVTVSVMYFTDLVMYSNSFWNLIVYSCRMPEFLNELKAIFCAQIKSSLSLKCLARRRKNKSESNSSLEMKQRTIQTQCELSLDNQVSA